MKFELPRTEDLRLTTFKFDFKCSYVNSTGTNTHYAKLLKYCMKIAPYTLLYQRQIQYYHCTAYDTLCYVRQCWPIGLDLSRGKFTACVFGNALQYTTSHLQVLFSLQHLGRITKN